MTFRNLLTGTILAVLIIWGPIDHSWPAWLAIRIGYLIFVPLIVWFLLEWLWKRWDPDSEVELILDRILFLIISFTLFTIAFFKATAKTHIGNTLSIQTRDGIEDVGDPLVLSGPDWQLVFVIIVFALMFLWYGVIKKDIKVQAKNK